MASNPIGHKPIVAQRKKVLANDIVAGIAFSCILSVLCGVAICKNTISLQQAILVWLTFLVVSGLSFTVPKRATIPLAIRIGLPASMFLFLTLMFISVSSAFFAKAKDVVEIDGQRYAKVIMAFASFGEREVMVKVDSKVRQTESKSLPSTEENGIAKTRSEAIIEAFFFYVVIAVFTSVGLAVSFLAKDVMLAHIKSLYHIPNEVFTKTEFLINTCVRIASLLGGAIAAFVV